jgi:hypothetical protein
MLNHFITFYYSLKKALKLVITKLIVCFFFKSKNHHQKTNMNKYTPTLLLIKY